MWTQMEKQVPEHAGTKETPAPPESAAAQLGQIAQAAASGDSRRPLDLDAAMRERMEQKFGLDFSAVRLEESALPGRLGADAVAQGDVIRFAPGAFQPDTPAGEQLLSHELGHVVQQSRGIDPAAQAGLPFYDPAAEHGADDMARQAMSSEVSAGPVQPFSPAPAAQAPMEGNRFGQWIKRMAGGLRRRFSRSADNDVVDPDHILDDVILSSPAPIEPSAPAPTSAEPGAPAPAADETSLDDSMLLDNSDENEAAQRSGPGLLGRLFRGRKRQPHRFHVLRDIALQRRAQRQAAYEAWLAEQRAAQDQQTATEGAAAAPGPAGGEQALIDPPQVEEDPVEESSSEESSSEESSDEESSSVTFSDDDDDFF